MITVDIALISNSHDTGRLKAIIEDMKSVECNCIECKKDFSLNYILTGWRVNENTNRNYALQRAKGNYMVMVTDQVCDYTPLWAVDLLEPFFKNDDVIVSIPNFTRNAHAPNDGKDYSFSAMGFFRKDFTDFKIRFDDSDKNPLHSGSNIFNVLRSTYPSRFIRKAMGCEINHIMLMDPIKTMTEEVSRTAHSRANRINHGIDVFDRLDAALNKIELAHKAGKEIRMDGQS